MIHLKSVHLRSLPPNPDFPFSLPLLQTLRELRFNTPVTLMVGENGTGKSTLLEGLACAAEMVVVGSESTRSDRSLAHARELARYFKLSWTNRTRRGFFLRAEDFFGYSKHINQMQSEMESDLHEIDEEYKDRSDYARDLGLVTGALPVTANFTSIGIAAQTFYWWHKGDRKHVDAHKELAPKYEWVGASKASK